MGDTTGMTLEYEIELIITDALEEGYIKIQNVNVTPKKIAKQVMKALINHIKEVQ